MKPIIAVIAGLFYLAATLVLIRRLSRGIGAVALSPLPPLALAGGGVLVHGYLLAATLFGAAGLRLDLFNAGSLIAWTVSLILIVTALRKPVLNLGVAIFPITGAFAVVAAFAEAPGPVVHTGTLGLQLHILSSLVAYSLLTIAAVQALLLAAQEHQLRSHHPGGVVRALPPLQTMEALLFQMISVGLALLSVALLTGLIYLEDIFAQHLIHKTVLSIIAWLVFAVLLWGRWRLGWRGQVAIRWTLAGFATLMLAYFGSKFVLEVLLHRI